MGVALPCVQAMPFALSSVALRRVPCSGVTARYLHVPMIRFRHGRGNKTKMDSVKPAAVDAPAFALPVPMGQLRPVELPARYHSVLLTQEDIDLIELGGAS